MLSKIRVAEVIFSLDYGKFGGGAERFALSLTQHLNRDSFEVVVCALWAVGTASEEQNLNELFSKGVETVVLANWNEKEPCRSFWVSFKSLWEFAAGGNIQIFHSHSQFGDMMLLFLKLCRSANLIVRTIHDGYPREWKRRPLRRLLFTNFLYPIMFDAEVGVNTYIVKRLNQRLLARILRRRAVCIHNAIDTNRFGRIGQGRDAMRSSLGVKAGEFLIGSIGRLVPEKGFEILIEAIPEVLSSVPQCRFLIIGEGPNADFLQRLARYLKVEDHVIFAGARSDVEDLLACMDLFVLPSFWEGLPTSILESMAAGTPVVATGIPGNQILIQDQVNGWVVPPGNASALAKAIVVALQNPQLRAEFAYNAKKTVDSFSLDKIAKKYEDLYLALVRARS